MSSQSEAVTLKVLLVRHGETDSNVHRILQGSLDTPLNSTGKQQAQETAKALANTVFHRAYCSSLQRCIQTAESIVSGRAMRTSYSRDIWEKDLGILEGMKYRDAVTKMHNENKILDNYGEGQKAFAQRLTGFWEEQVLGFAAGAQSSECMLIVTHGGCIATLCNELAKGGYQRTTEHSDDFVVPRNCSITEIEIDKNGAGRISKFGDQSHISTSRETLVGADAAIGAQK